MIETYLQEDEQRKLEKVFETNNSITIEESEDVDDSKSDASTNLSDIEVFNSLKNEKKVYFWWCCCIDYNVLKYV